jgi:catechol 2,3-dioxygenase-like lactoylglutathione lyase family enzyme
VHHVTFVVPALQEACDRAAAHGYRIVGFDDSDPGWAEAFLHPKEALGIVVQIVETRATGVARRPWSAPSGPPSPPAPVTVLGLRMRVRSVERAETQWRRILHGVREGADGAPVYRWPGSPMRIAVDVDANADEGPVAIEYASDHSVALPAAPHSVLGATFRQVRS